MNPYEQKQEARRERLEARAERLAAESNRRFDAAHDAVAGIPFGQPILVGHHSEGRHRSDLARHDRNMRKAIELNKAAQDAAGRASSVGSGGISSDDPDAVVKLKEKLADLESDQAKAKAVNAAIRKHAKAGHDAQVAALGEMGYGASIAAQLLKPDFCGRVGFPDYDISNRSASIRSVKQRIEQLGRAQEREHKEVEWSGIRVVQNVEENRLQLFFPSKAAPAIIAALKSHGFRWAPSVPAWQRQLSNGAIYAAQCVARVVGE